MKPAPLEPDLTTDHAVRAGDAELPSTDGGAMSTDGGTVSRVAAATDPDETAVNPVAADRRSLPRIPAIPGYEVEAVLGRGGMGVVYKARHVALKRTVALKMVLAGGHAAPAELARFRTEAEAVARLQHPNIVQIHEVGEVEGFPYCALEFVEGGTLAGKLAGGPLPPRDAAAVVEQLARAMQLAHSRNVIHRDLKPANVLLGTDNKPKVTDFGLARQTDTDSGMTKDGAVMGTPSYMAPEQASGHTHEAGPAADVYALGAILYECLTGRPPFKGKNVVETLELVRTKPPEPPSKSHPKTPADLETVCLKCLRKEPEKRYSSAQELADDLARYLRHEPVAARPVGRTERFRLWWRRNPALAPLLAALVVLVLGTAITAVVVAFKFSKLADDLTDALAEAKAEKDKAVIALANEKTATEKMTAALAESRRAHGLSLQSEARQAWAAGNVAQARERLAAVDPSARFWAWHYLNQQYHPTGFYPEPLARVPHVAWSPDGGTLASGTNTGEIILREGDTAAVRRRFPAHKDDVRDLAWSPDGRHLATVGRDGACRVWTVADGTLLREMVGARDEFTALAWPQHGNWIAVGCADGRVRLWDALTGKERPALPAPQVQALPIGEKPGVSALAFDPSGRVLARAAGGDLTLFPLDGSPPQPFPGTHSVLSLAFSPDGKLLAVGGSKLELFDAATGDVVRELPLYAAKPEGYSYLVTGLDFRGDGSRLATSCGGYAATSVTAPGPDGTIRVWDVNTGRQVRTIRPVGGPVHTVRYSPDGQRLAAGCTGVGQVNTAGGVGVWDVRTDGDHRLLSGCDLRPVGMATFPDGRRLATISGTDQSTPPGELVLWDVAAGVRLARRGHPTAISRVAVAPDGKTLLTADGAGTLDVWEAATLERVKTIPRAHAERVSAVDFLPDGRPLSVGEDGRVRVWNPAAGAAVAELLRPAEAGVKYPIGAAHPRAACVAIAGRLLNGDGVEAVLLWWPDDGKTVPLGDVTGGATALAFSADGELLAVAGASGELILWDVNTGKQRLRSRAHPFGVTGVAFHPDGRRIATIAADRAVRVWDVETGREALALTGPRFAADSLRFTADGARLVAAGGGSEFELLPFFGDVFVWDAAPFTDTSARPDPAWHAGRVGLSTDLTAGSAAFHGPFALRQPLPAGIGPKLVDGFGEWFRQSRLDDPRRAAFRAQFRATCDTVAAQSPDDEWTRHTLIGNAVATGPSDPIHRRWWARILTDRPVSAWTVIAAGAYLDGDPARVLAALAKGKSDTPLDAALTAWVRSRQKDPQAKAAIARARELAKGKDDPLLKELLQE